MTSFLPVGKLPHQLLEKIIQAAPTKHPRVLMGPGVGLDCAVLDNGKTCLILKTEPITFACEDIGWYAVQIAANDIATTGAVPSWAMFSVLLPEGSTTEQNTFELAEQLAAACQAADITVIGGHTEITHNLDRPIIVTTLVGEIEKEHLITPDQACPGDVILLTKGVPIEATALLAREFPDLLEKELTDNELAAARNYLYEPGLSVLKEAQIALQAGKVTAMHDPTEGGVATALWELASACQQTLLVDPKRIPVFPLAEKICRIFDLDPLGTIASGSLLLAVDPASKNDILAALTAGGIPAAEIGAVVAGSPQVLTPGGKTVTSLPRFDRDEIGRVYEKFALKTD